jgi:hypothetical protein
MGLLDFEPGKVSNTLAMHMGRNEKKGERISLCKFVEHHYGASHPFATGRHIVGYGARAADRFVDIVVRWYGLVGQRPESLCDTSAECVLQAASERWEVGMADGFERDLGGV